MEEVNLMCVFEGQDREDVTTDIKNMTSHIQDNETLELAGQVSGKPEGMSDEEFAEIELEAAE